MPEYRRAKTEIRFEAGNEARETHPPRQALFALLAFLQAFGSDVAGHLDGRADLPADGVHLAPGIAYDRDEKRSLGGFVRLAKSFCLDMHRGQPGVVDFERRVLPERLADRVQHERNRLEKVLDHLGRGESEFFAAHAAQQTAQREKAQASALRLIQKRTKAFADAGVIGKPCGERFLCGRAGFDSRRRRAHQLGRIGGGFAERQIKIGKSAALGIVSVNRPQQN